MIQPGIKYYKQICKQGYIEVSHNPGDTDFKHINLEASDGETSVSGFVSFKLFDDLVDDLIEVRQQLVKLGLTK